MVGVLKHYFLDLSNFHLCSITQKKRGKIKVFFYFLNTSTKEAVNIITPHNTIIMTLLIHGSPVQVKGLNTSLFLKLMAR